MSIVDSLRQILIHRMLNLGIIAEPQWSTTYLCIKYYDIVYRYCFFGKACNLNLSNELNDTIKTLDATEMTAFKDICFRLENGKTIFPYLSNFINKTNVEQSDFFLKNWNIFHAHLGILDKQSGKCSRSDRLLFFTKKYNEIYLIDIKKHPHGDEWFLKELLEIIDRSWPNLLQYAPFALNKDVLDKDYFRLSKEFVVPTNVNGKCVMPTNLGVTLSKDSEMAVANTNVFMKDLLDNYGDCFLVDTGHSFVVINQKSKEFVREFECFWSAPVV